MIGAFLYQQNQKDKGYPSTRKHPYALFSDGFAQLSFLYFMQLVALCVVFILGVLDALFQFVVAVQLHVLDLELAQLNHHQLMRAVHFQQQIALLLPFPYHTHFFGGQAIDAIGALRGCRG